MTVSDGSDAAARVPREPKGDYRFCWVARSGVGHRPMEVSSAATPRQPQAGGRCKLVRLERNVDLIGQVAELVEVNEQYNIGIFEVEGENGRSQSGIPSDS